MIERFKGTESDWWPYLNVLPTDYTTLIASYPMFPAHILPQSSRFLYAAQEKEVEKSYARVKKFCETELPDFSCSLQEFLWAFNTVNSRCVYKENNLSPLLNCSDGDSIAVMPLIDMINHSPTAMVSF